MMASSMVERVPSSPPRKGRSLCFPIPPPYPGHCARMASLSSLHSTLDKDLQSFSSGYVSTTSSSSESEHDSACETGINWSPPISYGRSTTTFPVTHDPPLRWSLAPDQGGYVGLLAISGCLPYSSAPSSSPSRVPSSLASSPLSLVTGSSDSPSYLQDAPSYGKDGGGWEGGEVPAPAPGDTVVVERQSRGRSTDEERELEKWRRRSVPASMRDSFSLDVARVLERDGHLRYETNVDTGRAVEGRPVTATQSVLQLARRFAEINAAQDLERHRAKKRSLQHHFSSGNFRKGTAFSTSSLGGIASLSRADVGPVPSTAMPHVDFKQLDAQNKPSIPVQAPRSPNSIKDALLRWVQSRVHDYPVEITNFSSSWADGRAFAALIHRFHPSSFDFSSLGSDRRATLDLAFRVAEEHGIAALLETEDMLAMGDRPDWKCVFTYVQQFYKKFREWP